MRPTVPKERAAARVLRQMKKHLRWLGERFEKVEDVRREHPSKRWSVAETACYVVGLMLQGFPSALAADEALAEGDEALRLLEQRKRASRTRPIKNGLPSSRNSQ